MDIHWNPSHLGVTKINVHGVFFQIPMPNGNISGIRIILRRSNGSMVSSIAGTIPNFSPLGVHLWAVYLGMRRAYIEVRNHVIVETDSIEAFVALKFHQLDLPPDAAFIVQ